MPPLKSIKNRIKSINSIQKITQAMKIVSASHLKQAQNNIERSKDYLYTLQNLLVDMYDSDQFLFKKNNLLYLKESKKKNILFMLFSSDKGLCGSFNSKIINTITSEINLYKKQNKNYKIICIGNKISQYMLCNHKNNVKIAIPFIYQNGKNKGISYNNAVSLSKKLKNLFKKGNFDECRILYTKFQSIMTQNITNMQLFPLNFSDLENVKNNKQNKNIFEFDNDLSSISEQAIINFINATIFNVYANSIVCEHSARMIAMDNATQNSKKILKKLNLLYNRSRQALITKELVEIISGAEAIN